MAVALVTSCEAAGVLGVRHTSIRRLARQGKLPALKLANRWLIERDAFEAFQKTYVGKRGRPKGYSPKRRAAE